MTRAIDYRDHISLSFSFCCIPRWCRERERENVPSTHEKQIKWVFTLSESWQGKLIRQNKRNGIRQEKEILTLSCKYCKDSSIEQLSFAMTHCRMKPSCAILYIFISYPNFKMSWFSINGSCRKKVTYNGFTSVSPAVAATEWATSISLSFSRNAARFKPYNNMKSAMTNLKKCRQKHVHACVHADRERRRRRRTSNGSMLAVDLKNLSKYDPSSEKDKKEKIVNGCFSQNMLNSYLIPFSSMLKTAWFAKDHNEIRFLTWDGKRKRAKKKPTHRYSIFLDRDSPNNCYFISWQQASWNMIIKLTHYMLKIWHVTVYERSNMNIKKSITHQ